MGNPVRLFLGSFVAKNMSVIALYLINRLEGVIRLVCFAKSGPVEVAQALSSIK